MAVTDSTPATVSAWAVPGVPLPRPAVEPSDDVVLLQQALDVVLAIRPSLLAPEAALDRAAALLQVQERLQAASLEALADVDERDLQLLAGAGSARTWLKTQPPGDTGQLVQARLLADRPLLRGALASGAASLRSACTAGRALGRIPAQVNDEELRAVLVDGAGQVLGVWAGSACPEPTPVQEAEFEERRDRIVAAARAGLDDTSSSPAERLEPMFTLIAEALTPVETVGALNMLADALQPEAAGDDAADQAYRSRDLSLRKLSTGGWSLRAHLTDEVGQHLADALAARDQKHPLQPDTAASTAAGTADSHGAAGAGVPLQVTDGNSDPVVEGAPLPSLGQRAHDALAQLIADLTALPATLVGTGSPAPASLILTASVDALDGKPGAPPPRLQTRNGPAPLSLKALRRLGCAARIAAVLIDAAGRPVGASGEHRHATARERRAMHAGWGYQCAVNGCDQRGTIPHHVDPWWKSRRTRHADLAPLCQHHHHDVHEGGKTLRLRDGRRIDALGWR